MKERPTTEIQKRFRRLNRSLAPGEQVAVTLHGKVQGYYRRAGSSRKPDKACLPPPTNLTVKQVNAIIEEVVGG